MSDITVKNYLPLSLKQVIIKNIVSSVIDEETGNVEFSLVDFFTEVSLLINYTDYKLSDEDTVVQYDEIKENGTLLAILEQIPSDEAYFIKINVEKEIQQYLDDKRSIGIQFKNAVDKLLSKLPSEDGVKYIMTKLPDMIKDIEPEKLQYLSQAIGWNTGKVKPNRQQRRKAEKENKKVEE